MVNLSMKRLNVVYNYITMIKNLLLLSCFLTASILEANTSELEKFNNAKSTFSFTENKGQVSDQNYNPRPDVLFSGAANGLQFHIRKAGISYQTSRVDSWKQKEDESLPEGVREEGTMDSVPDQMTIYRTDINWLGFNRDYTIENGESTAGFNNYYLPTCPDGAMNVKSYTDVTFKNLYTGVDVKWYEKNGELEYDFIVAPNTDYTKISWEIKGADRISIGENGQLIIETPLGNIEEQAPIAFQGETIVEAAWKIDGNKISFQLGSFNPNETLIIDPVVRLWGTYYGGTGNDYGYSCATDASGNVYLAGSTTSTTGIATTGAHQTAYGGGTGLYATDAFLVKFNSSGVRQWGTYYGGASIDYGYSCATDGSGNVYIAGNTLSTTGIATTGAHQTANGGAFVAFLVKFNSSGVRQWGTYYSMLLVSGGTYDAIHACATDASGNVYLSGYSGSTTGMATTGAHQTAGGGSSDAFLVKFNSSGVRQWGTYYGGLGSEAGSSCITDASGNVYLSGYTANSVNGIATTGAHQTTSGGWNDLFLVKFNSNGVRQWGTYYGGLGYDVRASCASDAYGNIYLAGTHSAQSTSGIATTGAHQTIGGGQSDAFLVKFNSVGVRQWGTYYGGGGVDFGMSCATDASGNVYLSGETQSRFGIATSGAHQTNLAIPYGSDEAFLVKFNSNGTRQWGTYYGGSYSERGLSIATDARGGVYLAGFNVSASPLIGRSTGLATIAAHQAMHAGGTSDAFLVKFDAFNPVFIQDSIVACNSYKWIDGVTYTASNTSAIDSLVTSSGRDSIVSLNLTINYTKTFTDSIVACDSYKWIDGVTYTDDNTSAKDTLLTSNGCDSIVSLNLTINDTKTSTDSIVANDSCTWINGVTYTSNNSTATDTLAASNGCDSIVSLNLTIVSTVGIDNPITLSNVKVYPNPTSGKLTIDAENYKGVEVYDVSGRLIIKSALKTIDLEEQSKGLYLLKIKANGTTQEFKVFKE